MAEGSRRQFSYVKEGSFGVDPGGNYQIVRALEGAGFNLDRTQLMSQEYRSDRAISTTRLGAKRLRFPLPFELSYGSHEDFIESAMCNAWVAAGSASDAMEVTVVAGTTNTMAGTGIGTGIVAGDWVKMAGFVTTLLGNNGWYKVTAAAANLLTFGEAVTTAGASTLTAGTSGATVTRTKMSAIVSGTTDKSLVMEHAQLDIPLYYQLLGCMAGSMSLSIRPDSIVTGSFDMMCKELASTSPRGTTYAGTAVAATTTEPMDANTATAALKIDGTPVAIVTGLDLNLNNNLAEFWPVFQTTPYKFGKGRSNLSGSMSLYLLSDTYWAKYLAETNVALSIQLMNPAGTNGYVIDIPSVEITSLRDQATENNVVSNINWQALYNSTYSYVNMKIAKLS
jgi:hypothetical protein